LIAYIQPNEDPALQWFNPNRDEFLTNYLVVIDYFLTGGGRE